jgi:hypothetical protein
MGEGLSKLRTANQGCGFGHEVVRQAQQQGLLKRMAHQLKTQRQTGWAKTGGDLYGRQAQQIEGPGEQGDAANQSAHGLSTAIHIRASNGGQGIGHARHDQHINAVHGGVHEMAGEVGTPAQRIDVLGGWDQKTGFGA